jgi:hypothetical protein
MMEQQRQEMLQQQYIADQRLKQLEEEKQQHLIEIKKQEEMKNKYRKDVQIKMEVIEE